MQHYYIKREAPKGDLVLYERIKTGSPDVGPVVGLPARAPVKESRTKQVTLHHLSHYQPQSTKNWSPLSLTS